MCAGVCAPTLALLLLTNPILTEDTATTKKEWESTMAKKKCEVAQKTFVQEARASIDAAPNQFFERNHWMNVTPSGGSFAGPRVKKLTADLFDAKAVACWVPHLIVPCAQLSQL